MKIQDVCEVVRGSSPRPQGDSRYYGGPVPRLMVADVTRDGMYVTPHIDSLTEEGAARSRPMKAGDLVIAVSGAPGLPAILKTDACIHDGFVGLRNLDQETVNPEFLYRYLYYVKTQSGHGAVGAIFKNLTSDQIRDLEIPLPPLPEQKRIADILDKADAIRRKRREANELAGTFQHGLFSEMFGDPISNELEWPVKSFGEMASNQDGRRKPIKASDREKVSGEYPYYGASGIIDYVDSYLFDETALLVGEDGANLLARSTPIAFLATGKYWVNNHAHVVTPNGNATLLYLATHLNMRSIRDFVTGSAQPKLNQSNLNKIPIPCPPIELQEEFDRRVSTFDLIRKKQDDADKEVESTFNSLVQRAFKGEL